MTRTRFSVVGLIGISGLVAAAIVRGAMLVSAATTPQADQVAKGRLEFPGFSVTPPPGPGWELRTTRAAHAAGFDVLFVRRLGPAEFAEAHAVGYHTATGQTRPAEILKATFERAIKPESQSLKTSRDRLAGAECIRWEATRELRPLGSDAEPASERKDLVSRFHGYLCSHPDAPAYVVQIAYSETAPKDSGAQLVPEEGDSFIKSFVPTRLGVHVTQFQVGREARAVASGYKSVWVTEQGRGVISRINPRNGTRVTETRVGTWPQGFAVGHGAVWVANWASDTVSRINPRTNRVAATIHVGRGPSGVVADGKSVWVTSEKDQTVSRIDPATNAIVDVIHVDGKPVAIAAGADALWVENLWSDQIWRIDPDRSRVAATIHVGRGRHMIASDSGAVWVSNENDGTVVRIDPATNQVVATVVVGHAPIGLTPAGGMLWVANFADSTLVRIDESTNQLKGPAIPVGESPFFLGQGEKMLWTLSAWGHWHYSTISRVDF